MLKYALLAAACAVFSHALICPSALAQGREVNALDSMGNTGQLGDYGHSSWRGTETNKDYDHAAAPGNVQMAPEGWADFTSTQGVGSPNGPNIRYGTNAQFAGPGGSSGAATGAPFVGTYTAPANMALKAQGRNTLPPTRLSSFVKTSGMNDHAFGDEGTNGLPPYSSFSTLDCGVSSQCTTGHQSDCPSAWGYPN